MVTLTFFLKNSVLPIHREFPDDCEIHVGRGASSGEFTVTRTGARFDVRIPLATLSEDHARVTLAHGTATITDRRSRNGTMVRLEPGVPHPMAGAPVSLGSELSIRVEDGIRALPEGLERLTPDSLCDLLRVNLDPSATQVTLSSPTEGSFPLEGDPRHLVVCPAPDRTLGVDDVVWVQSVVNAFNATVDARRSAGRWQFTAASTARRHALEQARMAAPTGLGVLLVGPAGAGKGVLAQDIHENSRRGGGPFVTLQCSGFTPDRLERELFGHARDVVPGSLADRPGLVEEASGGTLFLDGVSDLPLVTQASLARFLESETGEFRRAGDPTVRHARVRMIAATQRDPATEAAAGRFRHDLFYRLAGIRLVIPAMSPEDIAVLTRTLLADAARHGRSVPPGEDLEAIAQDAATRTWPGGGRELRVCVERCLQSESAGQTWLARWQVAADGAPSTSVVPPEPFALPVQPAVVGRLLADVLFLTAAREARGRPELATRLHMTYQGADARLASLRVAPGDLPSIEHRLAQCIADLRAYIADSPSLRALLQSTL